MAYTTIDKPEDYFNTKLYVGDGTTSNAITGVGFQPDWVWTKNRTNARGHGLFDSVRGADKWLQSNNNLVEQLEGEGYGVLSFDTDGFTVGNGTGTNESGSNMVAWNWLAGGTASSNTDGSITSNVSASTTSGFSIVSYTGNGSAGATIGHGLSAVPNIIITKGRSSALNWFFFDSMSSYLKRLKLNTTDAQADTDGLNDTAPTSSVFTVSGGGEANTNGVTYIAYLFAEKKGFSKFGSYTGNGNADGTFVYTGFAPAFVLRKRTDSTQDWTIFDNKRPEYNVRDKKLEPNTSDAEASGNTNRIDVLSNGFKCRGTGTATNASGGSYIYMAFASNPFVTSAGIPTTAR